jgi:hypothetical protein
VWVFGDLTLSDAIEQYSNPKIQCLLTRLMINTESVPEALRSGCGGVLSTWTGLE